MRSHPRLAPFGRWSHISIIATTVAAGSLATASVWGANQRIQDDWGQIAVALFLIAMPLYRPVSEVIVVAVVSGAVLGVTAAIEGGRLQIAAPLLVYALVAATPVLALAFAGCGYAWTMTGETLAWRQVARAAQARLEAELREAAQRMIAQERVTMLNEEAVPFLADVLARGEVTEEDQRRSAEIAARLRSAAVGSVGRTWLAETLAQALVPRGIDARPGDGPELVSDPDRLDGALTHEQRAIVGAVLVTIARLPGLDPASVRIVASRPEHPSFLITAFVSESGRAVRKQLLPYLSSLRCVAMEASVRVVGGELRVQFGYPERDNR